MLIDRDLANIYQVEVKQMNRQVKRNIDRFPEDFMFQLTKTEYDSLKCHFGTSNKRGGDRRALPYAFTQQGVGMLSGLLRSEIAAIAVGTGTWGIAVVIPKYLSLLCCKPNNWFIF